ncbi:VOC family protein [Rathayibacter sp. VKM Ac-2856]|uniref:VOC family protein n=1 Tax=unclassified Rathayibacter TaxID=2609250 RepID=UPI0015631107|nr:MULTISPECIES: VOC family protein [unclassified Rathayibacter]NQX06095.1 VOC family protein [Rathayibacter sp. VKM Ac-2858]NQX20955.1 VOC family protein [Rathayibacter sp. VKM Ac-2856]
MTGRIRNARVAGVSIDCEDHRVLSEFYARLLGGRVIWTTDGAAGVSAAGYHLVAQRVSPYERPQWPGTSVVHLDLTCEPEDLDAFRAHALECGAVLADDQPDARWVVLLDPAGHPFCLTPLVTSSAVASPTE